MKAIIPTTALLFVLGCGCQQVQVISPAESEPRRTLKENKVDPPVNSKPEPRRSLEEDEIDVPESFKKALGNPNTKACLLRGTVTGYRQMPFCSGKTSACGVNPTCKFDSRMRTTLQIPGFRIDKQLMNKYNLKLPDALDVGWPLRGTKLGDAFLILYVLRVPQPNDRATQNVVLKQRGVRVPRDKRKYYLMFEPIK